MIMAHLNGGPRDDQYINLERDELVIYRQERLPVSLSEDPSPIAPAHRLGRYRSRLDAFGQRVPHDLTGVVEFDWQGWDGRNRESE